jgi:predicted nucleotidyltransferase
MDRKLFVDDLREEVSEICAEEEVAAAYLFGSFARGDDDEMSDVDIGLVFNQDDYSIQDLLEIGKDLSKELVTDRDLDVRALNDKDVVFQKNAIADSILLYEGNKQRRIEFEKKVFKKYNDMRPHINHYNDKRSERIGA